MADTWWNCSVMVLTVMTVTTLFTGASSQCRSGEEQLTARSKWRKLRYPIFWSYSNNQNCRWVIETRPGEVIQLRDLEMDLEENSGHCIDYVQIYDGDTQLSLNRMRTLCTSENLNFYSSGNFMTITFYSDGSVVGDGFVFEYRSLSPTEVPFSSIWPPATSTTSKPSRDTFDTAAVIGGPVIGLICIIFFAGICRLCCRRPTQPSARPYSAQASAPPYGRDPAHPSNQGPMFMTSSAAYAPTAYEGHTNEGFSSFGEAPPSYEHVVASSPRGPQGGGVVSVPTALPSYDDVIMMSGNATEPKPE